MDQRAGLGIGARVRRAPERVADVDLIRLGRVDIGVVALRAAAVDGDLAAALVHRAVDRREMLLRGGVTAGGVGAEPTGVARAGLAGVEVALRVLGVGPGRVHGGAGRRRARAGAADIVHAVDDSRRSDRFGGGGDPQTLRGRGVAAFHPDLQRCALGDHRQAIGFPQHRATRHRRELQRRAEGDVVGALLRQIVGFAEIDGRLVALAGAQDREVRRGRHGALDHAAFVTDFFAVAADREQIGFGDRRRQLPFRDSRGLVTGVGHHNFDQTVAKRHHADAQRVGSLHARRGFGRGEYAGDAGGENGRRTDGDQDIPIHSFAPVVNRKARGCGRLRA